jgi:hypothetical protein
MDIAKIFKEKNISDSSANLYLKNLIRLNDNKPIKNLNFLKDSKKIMEKIKDKAYTTQRSYIISIISLLKQLSGQIKFKILYNDYFDILEKMNTDLKNRTEKTENEKNCWMTNEEITKLFDEKKQIITEIKNKKKLTEEQFENLLGFVILSLYYLQPPRRNLDYQLMNVIKKYTEDLNNKVNYLNLSNKQFIFNQYKTKGKYEKQILEINNDLMEILNIWLKFHPNKKEDNYKLLVHFDGSELTNNNDITRILNKIFKCKIGSSMLRKMYHTNKYGKVMEELKKDSVNMSHSVDTILNNYIKK